MKKYFAIFAVCFIVAGCVGPGFGDDPEASLEISSVSVSSITTKSVINGPAFPAEEASKGLGLFLTGPNGSLYDGLSESYANVKYYYDGSRWNSDESIMLSASSGTLSGYFPFNPSVTDIKSIPVESSLDGTDYMYFEPVTGVNVGSRNVSIEMKHALALVSIKFVKDGDYAGDGLISSISLSGEGIAGKGLLDAATGTIKPSGTSDLCFDVPSPKGLVTRDGTVEEFLLVPGSDDGEGRPLNMTCIIDGTDYSLTFPDLPISRGMKSEVVVNVRNLGISVAVIDSGQWDDGITLTLPGGMKVKVETMKEVFDLDILANAHVSGNSVIVEAVSKAGYQLLCKVPENVNCTLVEEKKNGFKRFEITGITSDVTLQVGYDVTLFVRKDIPQKGYYKDIFLDAGFGLDAESTIPKAIVEMYGASSNAPDAIEQVEVLYTFSNSSPSQEDTLTHNGVICGREEDLNGSLLYPDGEPRFKLLYVYGGRAEKHGDALGAKGIENINTFFANGGSYSGSCAGCILSCAKYGGNVSKSHFDLFDGGNYKFSGMYISNKPYYNDITFEKGTKFDDFSGLAERPGLDSLRHNGGAYMDESSAPEGTEVLARFSTRPYPLENLEEHSNPDVCVGKPCLWAYKRSETSGRLVVCGSHPEICNTDNITSMFKGEIMYALDGFGNATVKDALYNGEPRVMNLKERDPGHCGIGDGQYHDFVIFLPYGASELDLKLDWDSKASLDIALKHESFASDNPDFSAESPLDAAMVQSPLSLKAKDLEPGLWYVSVHCSNRVKGVYKKTTINGTHRAYWFKYEKTNSDADLLTLNGVPYTITASWK